jgi:hypothetical protein
MYNKENHVNFRVRGVKSTLDLKGRIAWWKGDRCRGYRYRRYGQQLFHGKVFGSNVGAAGRRHQQLVTPSHYSPFSNNFKIIVEIMKLCIH